MTDAVTSTPVVNTDPAEFSTSPEPNSQIVVLALGNLLRTDEGLAIVALHRLMARYQLPENVLTVDGGTLGLQLLSYVEMAERMLVLDSVLTDGPPGTFLKLAGDDVPAFLGIRTSPHEIGLPDLLAVSKLKGNEPKEVVVIGLQPGSIELGWGLSEQVDQKIEVLVEAAVAELRAWGLEIVPAPPEK